MANRRKEQPTFNVDVNNSSNETSLETNSFIQLLVDNFQQGAYCILEAMRLVKSKDKHAEMDLILNNEKETLMSKMKKRLPYLK